MQNQLAIQIQAPPGDEIIKNDQGKYVDLSFTNLSYSVKVKVKQKEGWDNKTGLKPILNNVTGICPGGQMTAILGASGAGKTSLLNILAKRIVPSKMFQITGDIHANGKTYDSKQFANFAAYIMQNDILFETFTPREAFKFVADLKYKDTSEKDQIVDQTIKTLKLERCQHAMVFVKYQFLIGGEFNKGISGGERKRTSIGFELVADPKVIMLDEPTSGLDSFTAFLTMNLLKKLMLERNKTIIFTIHQPSDDIYQLFDRIILLVDGQMIYQGPKDKIIGYFAGIGFNCPQYSNPMDYFLSIMHSNKPSNVSNYPLYFQSYQKKFQSIVSDEIQNACTDQILHKKSQTSFGYQVSKICGRAFLNLKRDQFIFKGRLYQAIFMGLLLGGIYFGVASNPGGNIQSIAGGKITFLIKVLFFLSINHFFSSLNPVMIQFPAERAVFLKEENSRLYSTAAYFLGKSSTELPILIIVPIVQQLISYWMIKLNDSSASIVVIHFLIYCILSLCGNSVGLMAGCMFKDVKVASAAAPMIIMPLVLFSGFFKNSNNFMTWISWLQYLSPMKYAFSAAMQNQYSNIIVHPNPIELYSFDVGLWNSIYALVGYIVFYRIVAFIFLYGLKGKIQ